MIHRVEPLVPVKITYSPTSHSILLKHSTLTPLGYPLCFVEPIPPIPGQILNGVLLPVGVSYESPPFPSSSFVRFAPFTPTSHLHLFIFATPEIRSLQWFSHSDCVPFHHFSTEDKSANKNTPLTDRETRRHHSRTSEFAHYPNLETRILVESVVSKTKGPVDEIDF